MTATNRQSVQQKHDENRAGESAATDSPAETSFTFTTIGANEHGKAVRHSEQFESRIQ